MLVNLFYKYYWCVGFLHTSGCPRNKTLFCHQIENPSSGIQVSSQTNIYTHYSPSDYYVCLYIYPQGTILDDHAHEIRIRLASPVHCQWTFKLLSNAPLWLGLIRSCVDVVVLVLIYIQPTVYTNTLQCNLYTGWHAGPMVDCVPLYVYYLIIILKLLWEPDLNYIQLDQL